MATVSFFDAEKASCGLWPQISAAMDRVLRSGHYILGAEGIAFEQEFGAYCHNLWCVGVASGTEAIQLALMDAGVGYGDEVITVPNTAVPTVSAISSVGAKPLFVDIDPNTCVMDVSKIAARITPKTKAIIPVHLYGHSVDMDPLLQIAKEHRLVVIEDCAQSHGALYKGKKVGTLGDYGCFSFYPTKNLGAIGDAGAIVVQRKESQERLMMLRNYGQKVRYTHEIKGINSRLDDIQSAVLRIKLPQLDFWNAERRRLASLYCKHLANTPVVMMAEQPYAQAVYHLCVIKVERRDELVSFLQANGVQTLIHYPKLIPAQHAYKECADQVVHLPVATRVVPTIVSLPLYPGLPDSDVLYVCAMIQKFFRG